MSKVVVRREGPCEFTPGSTDLVKLAVAIDVLGRDAKAAVGVFPNLCLK
ncbi:MAG: hypothetical protein JO232_18950 [Verrucomicrobia bacterium]|nr:hypothetical protein [Verrucomicrobiota bacterium]